VIGAYLVAEEGLPTRQGPDLPAAGRQLFAVRDGLITRITTYYNLTTRCRWWRGRRMTVRVEPLVGAALARGLPALARLRIAVFRSWPYLATARSCTSRPIRQAA
jgi:hypothetical protein